MAGPPTTHDGIFCIHACLNFVLPLRRGFYGALSDCVRHDIKGAEGVVTSHGKSIDMDFSSSERLLICLVILKFISRNFVDIL